MALFFRLAFWLHVVAGSVALSVFWIPLVTKKGASVHRRVGWVYVGAAATIAATAFVNCARMLTDGIARNDRAGVFLAYVGLLAAESALHGVRALGTKGRTTGARGPMDVAPAAVLGAGGVALAVYGLRVATPLYLVFGVLGVALATGHLRFWLRAPVTRREWFYAHMTGMGTSCITTVTAFVVVNAHRLGLGTFSPVVWLTPTAVGAAGLLLWRRRLSAPSPTAPRLTALPFASRHDSDAGALSASSDPLRPSLLPSRTRVWSRRVLRAIATVAIAGLLAWRLVPRPAFLPLATRIDGPAPADAAAVIVFLHGKSGGLGTAELLARALREEGLPGNVAIVLVEGPYHTWFGHQWGDTVEQQASSRQRVRTLLRELLGDRGPPPERVVIAGFSQGAGVAIDTAIEEPRIGRVASFSPCRSILRGELPKRDDLRVLLAHGAADAVCPVEESRSLARMLDEAHKPARYVEFDGPHTIPMEVVRALATFATAP